jgi:hypothetical protein
MPVFFFLFFVFVFNGLSLSLSLSLWSRLIWSWFFLSLTKFEFGPRILGGPPVFRLPPPRECRNFVEALFRQATHFAQLAGKIEFDKNLLPLCHLSSSDCALVQSAELPLDGLAQHGADAGSAERRLCPDHLVRPLSVYGNVLSTAFEWAWRFIVVRPTVVVPVCDSCRDNGGGRPLCVSM